MKYIFKQDDLVLPKGIVLSNEERIKICRLISSAINKYYAKGTSYLFGDKKLNYEYLSKAINNRTLLKKIVSDPNNEIVSNVKTKEDLFDFIKQNLFSLFNHKGKYFKYVYGLLESTSKRGYKFEDRAFKVFVENASKKGLNIEILSPSLEEDKYGGIDGIFFLNDKRYTIQVKPLKKDNPIQEFKKDPSKYIVFCDGVLKDLKTDYLIVVNNDVVKIFRTKGVICYPSNFIIPKENMIN